MQIFPIKKTAHGGISLVLTTFSNFCSIFSNNIILSLGHSCYIVDNLFNEKLSGVQVELCLDKYN